MTFRVLISQVSVMSYECLHCDSYDAHHSSQHEFADGCCYDLSLYWACGECLIRVSMVYWFAALGPCPRRPAPSVHILF